MSTVNWIKFSDAEANRIFEDLAGAGGKSPYEKCTIEYADTERGLWATANLDNGKTFATLTFGDKMWSYNGPINAQPGVELFVACAL